MTERRFYCVHCENEIEDRAKPSMDGRQKPEWRHVWNGAHICFPQWKDASSRAEP